MTQARCGPAVEQGNEISLKLKGEKNLFFRVRLKVALDTWRRDGTPGVVIPSGPYLSGLLAGID